MDYLLLNLVFTAIAAVAVWFNRSAVSVKVVAPTFVILALVTLIADNAIVGFGVVDYDASKILGARLGVAPIEDFGYLLVGVFLIPVIFKLASGYARTHRPIDLTGDLTGNREVDPRDNGESNV